MDRISRAVAWVKAHRGPIGVLFLTSAGVVHLLTPGSRADLVLAFVGTSFSSAGFFKSDEYHRDKQSNGLPD